MPHDREHHPRDSSRRRQSARPNRNEHRRRRGHQATDSTGALLPQNDSPEQNRDREDRYRRHRSRNESGDERYGSGRERERERHRTRDRDRDRGQDVDRDRDRERRRRRRTVDESGPSGDGTPTRGTVSGSGRHLSSSGLAALDTMNQQRGWKEYDEEYLAQVQARERRMERERMRRESDGRRRERDEDRRAREQGREEREERERQGEEREREREERKRAREEKETRRAERARIREERERRRAERGKRDTHTDGEVDTGREERRLDSRDDGYKDNSDIDEREIMKKEWKTGMKHKPGDHLPPHRTKRKAHVKEKVTEYTSDEDERKSMFKEWRTGFKWLPGLNKKKQETSQGRIRATMNEKRDAPGRRIISGTVLEKGRPTLYEHMLGKGGGSVSEFTDETAFKRRRRKRIVICCIIVVAILLIAIPVGVFVNKKNKESPPSQATDKSTRPSNYNLQGVTKDSIPPEAQGTLLDPFTWYDTVDFNLTYTAETVGGLSIMGINSTWDDDIQANPNVPNLEDEFQYGKVPIRGMNVGGWLNLEPFITPSFFSRYSARDGVIDEWTFTSKLGPAKSAQTLEQHYSSFITRDTFVEIRNAGFDHVRIPFGYWAVTTYDGDPYVSKIAWRYMLRGIEYCRQNGLRVKLDLHGAPGSQNGWNHSGRQGPAGWLNGTDGDLNAQRTLDIHDQLSTFFTQPRYKNLVTVYGLVNEPRMVDLDTNKVLDWTSKAISLIRKNNYPGVLVFGDGFMGLDKWQGKLQEDDKLVLDVHQYVIFNVDQLKLEHTDKLNFACKGWTAQTVRSQNKQTGFGPTMCGEWSQADTDCATFLNNVGVGSRWEGTLNSGNASTSVMRPTCPTENDPVCQCKDSNADPSEYTDVYKQWLRMFAEAQMESFEKGWGWFYWTWQTERAVQWSWKLGMQAGILPTKAYDRDFKCEEPYPDFGAMGLPENY